MGCYPVQDICRPDCQPIDIYSAIADLTAGDIAYVENFMKAAGYGSTYYTIDVPQTDN